MANEYTVLVSVDASGAVQGSRVFNRSLDEIANAANKAGKSTGAFGKILNVLPPGLRQFVNPATAVAAGVGAIGLAMVSAVNKAAEFQSAMARVRTLTGQTEADSAGLASTLKDLAVQFGSPAPAQAAAIYEIISAGIEDTAEATKILTTANKLAIGGITDVQTAADGLTSVLSAYEIKADKATKVSDLFFVSAAAGKTTIEELAQSIGTVSTVAAQSGVGVEELLAAVGAVTKTGLETSRVMTGIRSAILNIVKPSQQAAELAAKLGVDFSATALQSKGLVGVLNEVKEATQGDVEMMGRLFTSVEGLPVIMALAGSAAEDYNATLNKMNGTGGQTEDAFKIVNETFEQQFKIFKEQLNVALTKLGEEILPLVNEGLIKLNQLLGKQHKSETLNTFEELEAGAIKAHDAFKMLEAQFNSQSALDNVQVQAHEVAIAREEWQKWETAIRNKILADTAAGLALADLKKGVEEVNEVIKTTVELTPEQGKAWEELKKQLLPIDALVVDYNTNLTLLNMANASGALKAGEYQAALEKLNKDFRETVPIVTGATDVIDKFNEQQKAAAERAKDLADKQKGWSEKLQDTYKELDDVDDATEKYNMQISHLIELLTIGRIGQEEFNKAVDAAGVAMRETQAKGEESANVVGEEWKRATENMVDSLAGFFKDGLDGFDNFKESVEDTIKEMLANILAAITKSKISEALAGKFPKFQEMIGKGEIADATGTSGKTPPIFGEGGVFSKGKQGSFAGMEGVMGQVAGGMTGFAVGQAIGPKFGAGEKEAKAGSAIGAAIGSIFGPVGAFIGGALGGAAAGILFGGKEKVTGQGVTLGVTGGQVGGTSFTDIHKKGGLLRSSKRFTETNALEGGVQENLQGALNTAFEGVQGLAASLGVASDAFSRFNLAAEKISLDGLNEEQVQAKLTDFLQGAIGQGIEFFVDNTAGLSERLKRTVKAFKANSDQMIRAFELAAAVDLSLAIDPVKKAMELLAQGSRTAAQAVEEQYLITLSLSGSLDGTIGQLEAMATSLAKTKQGQFELVIALDEVRRASQAMFRDTAQMIRESLLNEEQLYQLRRDQFDALASQISASTDPGELRRLSEMANQVLSDAFGLLDETQRPGMAQEFLTALDQIEALVVQQTAAGTEAVRAQSADLDERVTRDMLSAANRQMEAANLMYETALMQQQFMQQFLSNQTRFAGTEIGL